MPPQVALAEHVAVVSDAAQQLLESIWAVGRTRADIEIMLMDILPGLIDEYGLAASSVAADWYDDLRDFENITGSFRAITADAGDRGAYALVGWATQPLRDAEPDFDLAKSRLLGGTQMRIADVARDTIRTSVQHDPQARGWQRKTNGDACGFCTMLASRGAVYTKSAVRFGSHDWCNCTVQPVWGGKPLPVHKYKPSARQATDADRQRTYAWIRANL